LPNGILVWKKRKTKNDTKHGACVHLFIVGPLSNYDVRIIVLRDMLALDTWIHFIDPVPRKTPFYIGLSHIGLFSFLVFPSFILGRIGHTNGTL
jgi:hypothetical protein